jgi:hypothetical protein
VLLASLAALTTLVLAGCAAPAPPPSATAPPNGPAAAAASARPATPIPTPAPLGLVVARLDESALPPADPAADNLPVGRPTPTPAATAEPAWKYVTLWLAVENRSETARLTGISGTDPSSTNLASATLATRDGARYRSFRSSTSFGLRTATGRSLTNYPVLLRLPPGFRAAAESFGGQSSLAPIQTSVTFKVPVGLVDYGTLTVPPVGSLGPKAEDEVSRRLRPLLGTFQPLDLGGIQAGPQPIAYPVLPGAAPPGTVPVGSAVSVPGKLTVTLASADVATPTDFQARNRGWKQLILALRYRNDDTSQASTFTVAGWFFGQDGVVYSGDVPAIGDFGRATIPPEAASMLLWDGRSAGAEQVKAGQEQEPRKLTFLVPNAVQGGILVLAGDVEASFSVDGLGTPATPSR